MDKPSESEGRALSLRERKREEEREREREREATAAAQEKERADKIASLEFALETVDKKGLAELRALTHPPSGVSDVTDALMALNGFPRQEWSSAKM